MTTSATQIDTFDPAVEGGCMRKWGWRHLDGISEPPALSAQLGSAVHKAIERFFKFGEPLDMSTEIGEIAMSGFHYWPSRGTPGISVEEKFRMDLGGIPLIGVKDLEWAEWQEGWIYWIVYDHKTTKDFRYAKTPETLATNYQAVLYTEEAFRRGAERVELRWTYHRTKRPYKAHQVKLRVIPPGMPTAEGEISYTDLLPTLHRAEEIARAQEDLRARGVRAISLPPNPASCEMYGGCPYRNHCNLSDDDKVEAIMSNAQSVQDMLSQVQQRVNPPQPSPQAQDSGPPPLTGGPGDPPEGFGWWKDPAAGWRMAPLEGWAPPAGTGPIFNPRAVAAPPQHSLPPQPQPQPQVQDPDIVTHPVTGVVYNQRTLQILHDPRAFQAPTQPAPVQLATPAQHTVAVTIQGQPQATAAGVIADVTAQAAAAIPPKNKGGRPRKDKAPTAEGAETARGAEERFLEAWDELGRAFVELLKS